MIVKVNCSTCWHGGFEPDASFIVVFILSSETPPPHINAHGGPPVLTDPSDPRLLKHSPPPHAGDVVPQDRWVTQYNLHYGRGPSEYSYQRGAFKLKEHRDIENVSKGLILMVFRREGVW